MPQENQPERPVPPALIRLQSPEQIAIRRALRIAGPVIFVIGVICVIIAVGSMISAANDFGPPRLFWLGFIGLPLLFVGSVLSMYGFMGAVARYAAGEVAPVAADSANYLAAETKDAVETVAKAAAKGVVEGLDAGRAKPGQGKD